MEIGYEDKPSTPTFEDLEQRFLDEIVKLAKEQCDAEDAENARHRERIIEINAQYQEKLSSLRAQQAKQREEFLLKEARARLLQYQQQAGSNQYPTNASPIDPRGHGRAAANHYQTHAGPINPHGYGGAAAAADAQRPIDPRGYGGAAGATEAQRLIDPSAVPVFGQPPVSAPSSGFAFGLAVPSAGIGFQFGNQQNQSTPQMPPPSQPSGSLEFGAGGSYSLGSGSGDKSARKIVIVKHKNRRRRP